MALKYTTKEFIDKVSPRHNHKYTYEKTVYTGTFNFIVITCPFHGDFEMSPNTHLAVHGCAKCRNERLSVDRRSNTEEFVSRATKIHNSKYSYENVVYGNNEQDKVPVTCKEHGDFLISPNNHLLGKGCKNCAKNGYRTNKAGNLYILQNGEITKIGITNNVVSMRCRNISVSSGKLFEIVYSKSFEDGSLPLLLETKLLQELKEQYKQPLEVFDGSTECFYNVRLPNLLSRIADLINVTPS